MEGGTSFSLEEYKKLVAEMAAEEKSIYRSTRFESAGREQLLWTALVPSWTVQLAQRSNFPVSNVEAYLADLQAKRLVSVSQVRGDEPDAQAFSLYTMDEVTRSDVIEAYAGESGQLAELLPMLTRIGGQMLDAIDHQVSNPPPFAPPSLVRWAVLAAHASTPSEIAQEFDHQIEVAFADRESGTIRDWVNAAQAFSSLMSLDNDDSLKQALQRASQRLVLLRREENDQRHLKYFYQRDEQLAAFKELMSSDDQLWAMHFLGAGGVGKTMLVRKITVDWAAEHDAIAARVDFDYLKADYPSLDPGMLLWAFGQDLRAHAGPDAIKRFNQADRAFQELSKRISSEMRDGSQRRGTDFEEFKDAISLYSEALRLLPKRVLLIVDTCEELAKISIGRTPVENINETFRILRALHDGVHTLDDDPPAPRDGIPDLRVIFSGRRPLSREGVNWHCPSASQLQPRDFLRLHEVRGFKKTDSATFLEKKMQVPSHLISAIVTRSSPDTGSVAEIVWDDPADGPSEEERCNPYDLKLYAEWASEDPPPTEKEILETPPATQYVELRVIRRLHAESLKQVLPAVALLGHFDSRALHAIFDGVALKDPIDTVFDLLQGEEWINQRQYAGEEADLILDVEAGLRTRLFVYFKNSPQLAEAQPRAAAYFEKITLEGDPNAVDWSAFDTAITVLECDPDKSRVFRWWKQVEERLFSLRPPQWVRDITAKLQNEGGAAALRDPKAPPDVPPESRLRPAVLATNGAARLQASRPEEINNTWRDLAEIWQEVLAKAPNLSQEMPELEMRARAGFVSASMRLDNSEPDYQEIGKLWQFVHDTEAKSYLGEMDLLLAVPLVAAAEAVVEFADGIAQKKPSAVEKLLTIDASQACPITTLLKILPPPNRDPESMFNSLSDPRVSGSNLSWSQPATRFLSCFAMSLAARAELLRGNQRSSLDLFKNSLDLIDYNTKTLSAKASNWTDWLPPEDLACRVRLEFVRAAYPAFMSPSEIFGLVDDAPMQLNVIDNERLHSALLCLRSALGPVPLAYLKKFEGIVAPNGLVLYVHSKDEPQVKSASENPEALACRAHHVTPPLFVTVGEALANQGRVDDVLSDLAAIKSRSDVGYKTLLDMDRVCSRIIMRMRLRDVGEKGGQTLKSSADISDLSLAWALDAHEGTRQVQTLPQLPKGLTDVQWPVINPTPGPTQEQIEKPRTVEREKLNWLHAIWQTRFVVDAEHAQAAVAWAEQNFQSCLEPYFEQFPCYELAAVQLDCFEAMALAKKYRLELNLGTVTRRSFPYEFFYEWKDLSPVEILILSVRARTLSGQSAIYSKRLVNLLGRVGTHRAAEIAFYEADLLSLRLPDLAAHLYRQAEEFFNDVGDRVGGFLAGTAQAMMSSHREASVIEQRIAKSYSELPTVESGNGLPSREDLIALVDKTGRERSELENWAPRSWRPSLVRYMLVLLTKKSYDHRAMSGRELIRNLLPAAIGSITDQSDHTASDLCYWLARAYEPPSFFRRAFNVTKEIFKVLLTLLSGFVGIGLIFKGFSWVFSFAAPNFPNTSIVVQLGTFGLVILILSLSIRLMRKVRARAKPVETETTETAGTTEGEQATEYASWRICVDFVFIWFLIAIVARLHFWDALTRFSWPRIALAALLVIGGCLLYVFRGRLSRFWKWLEEKNLKVRSLLLRDFARLEFVVRPIDSSSSSERASTEVPETEITTTIALPGLRFLQRLSGFRRTFGYRIPALSGLQPYDSLKNELTIATLNNDFDSARAMMRRFSLDVEIELPEGSVNGLCWESQILGEDAAHQYLPFNTYRKLSINRSHTRPQTKETFVLTLAESDAGKLLALSGWESPLESRIRFQLKGQEEVFTKTPRPEVSVIHLIGSPESSYLGIGLRLGDEQFTSKSTTETLLRVEDVTRVFPNLSACIIQEIPRAISTERLDGDRRDAFLARLFASQMFAAGVPFVLVIPPLGIQDAIKAINQFVPVLVRRSWFKQRQLLKAVGEMRLQIGRFAQSLNVDPATVQELPQDVCLYLNREWDGNLT